jgi:hypothetical protein
MNFNQRQAFDPSIKRSHSCTLVLKNFLLKKRKLNEPKEETE